MTGRDIGLYFGNCTEYLDVDQYFLKQRAKMILEDNYWDELFLDESVPEEIEE